MAGRVAANVRRRVRGFVVGCGRQQCATDDYAVSSVCFGFAATALEPSSASSFRLVSLRAQPFLSLCLIFSFQQAYSRLHVHTRIHTREYHGTKPVPVTRPVLEIIQIKP
jgi:hypothetical protein